MKRNATENDREGMLSRKHVGRRTKIENETPQKKEKIAKLESESKRKDRELENITDAYRQ